MCRNLRKAGAARDALLASHPSAEVSIVQMDVSSLQSVVQGAAEVRQRYVFFCLTDCFLTWLRSVAFKQMIKDRDIRKGDGYSVR